MSRVTAALRSLPLEFIIGAPLKAAIEAQALAALTTIDFIKEVGLKPSTTDSAETGPLAPIDDEGDDDGNPLQVRYVEFKFDRVLEEQVSTPGDPNVDPPIPPGSITKFRVVPSKLTVPLLAIIPIPYIRINDMTIDFEFKINDVVTTQRKSQRRITAKTSAKAWFVKTSIKGSYTSSSSRKRTTDQTATLRIQVNAVQDAMPEGLGRILDMLNEAMRVVPLGPGIEISSTTIPEPAMLITNSLGRGIGKVIPSGKPKLLKKTLSRKSRK